MESNIVVRETAKEMRDTAKLAIEGKWKKVIIAILIYFFANIIPIGIFQFVFAGGFESFDMSGGVDNLIRIYSLLVTGAFSLSFAIITLSIVRNLDFQSSNIFSGFNYYFKTLGLYLYTLIFICLWTVLFIIPGIIAALRYSQAFYIFADDPSKGIKQCVEESKELMKENKMKLFSLKISFIGWIFVGIFTGGIGFLWVVPYLETSMAVFYEILINNRKQYNII